MVAMEEALSPALSPQLIQALAALVPRRRPQLPRAADVLHPMLDFFSRDIRDFLFTPDAIHIPHLLSPASLSTALTCVARSTSIDPVPKPPRNSLLPGESHDLFGHMMFVPVITMDQVTIGVGVLNAAATCIPWMTDNGVSQTVQWNFRFARNAKTRTLLVVHDTPHDCYLVFTARVESTTRTRKSLGLFPKRDLRKLLLNDKGMVSAGDLLPLLMEAQYQVYYRDCWKCGAPSDAFCACQLDVPRPAHPFDVSCFRYGMSQHVNTMQAVASKVVYAAGVPKRHVVLGAQMTLLGIADANISQSLTQWSVSQYLQSFSEDPLHSLLIIANDDNAREKRRKNVVGNGHVCDANNVLELKAGAHMVQPMGYSKMNSTDDMILYTPSGTIVKSDAEIHLDSTVSPVDRNYLSAMHTEGNLMTGEEWLDQRGIADGKEVQPELERRNGALNVVRSSPSVETQDGATGSSSSPAHQRIAEHDDPVRQEKIRKAKERREKNRLAAHVSNMRNKRMRDQLKSDVQEAHEKVEMLRAKEVALRKENLQLRKLLGK